MAARFTGSRLRDYALSNTMSHVSSLITERLRAEPLTLAHFDEICLLHRDPAVMRTLSADGRPFPDDFTKRGLADAVGHWARNGFGLWAFYDKRSGRFVGRGGLKLYSIDGEDQVGLAYAVVLDQWGQGYATEIGEASLRVGFEELGLPQVSTWTLPINKASQRVMEKLGFRYKRDITFAGLPHRYYRLMASDWREART